MNKLFLILGFSLFFLIGCTGSNQINAIYPREVEELITLYIYERLKLGMSKEEVFDLIGFECDHMHVSEIEDVLTEFYTCNGSKDTGANAIITFQNEYLYAKTQTGLR